MGKVYLEEIRQELQRGPKEKGHPFRFFTFATVGLDHVARLRTVVMRDVDKDLKITFYTDKRSKKITHIKENKKVSLIFYHPEKLLQLRIEGIATYNSDTTTKEVHWSSIPDFSKKEYTTSKSPGTIINDPDKLEYLSEDNHFCIVEIFPHKMEYLKLGRPNHTRVRFSKVESEWESEFLVP
ncbi:pyridoxamine 5'-phosphate oxidase family protein [Arenibacter latericius]|uniref:pyridoxamine 5'-phosphate oxidase family protein n=1 Tax=Arenibacter latericius TaxID=86104 RepID=UPI0004092A95|nr:pyridoxamine 5'-phosphate oxidase family protein [Arenibacter latericius]